MRRKELQGKSLGLGEALSTVPTGSRLYPHDSQPACGRLIALAPEQGMGILEAMGFP